MAVIPVWNNKTDTLACVESLRASDYSALEVIVVDNGSTDGTAEALAACLPAVCCLSMGGNRGYTGGGNRGMEETFARGAAYALVLNNDTTLEPDCVRLLVEAAQTDPSIGVAAPAIYRYDAPAEPWFLGSALDLEQGLALHNNRPLAKMVSWRGHLAHVALVGGTPTPPLSDLGKRSNTDSTLEIKEVPWATGCAMLVSRAAFAQTGGFDERLFMYWEDVEWSLRLRAAGFRIALVPGAHLYHRVSRSIGALSPPAVYYSVRNNLAVVRQHCPPAARGRALRRTAWRHLREALRLAKNSPRAARALPLYALRGIADFARGRFGPLY